jgi:cytochrome P450
VAKAFSNEALTTYLPTFQKLTMKHLDSWVAKSATATARYAVEKDIQKYTFELAEELLLGMSSGKGSDQGLIDTFTTWLEGYEGVLHLDVPWTAHGKAMHARKVLSVEYQKIIDQKRASMTADTPHTDILARAMTSKDENGEIMSDLQLIDFCLVVMFAGHDTTKASIQSMLHLLATQRDVEKELREEVNKLWDGSSPITWKMIEAMEGGKCGRFLGEMLRLMPAVVGLYRVLTEDVEISGYTIPQGWKIMTSPAANHTTLGDTKVDLSIDHAKYRETEYMPFGGGARKCVGYRFARVELLVWLMCVLKNINFDLDPKESVEKTMPFVVTAVKCKFSRQ